MVKLLEHTLSPIPMAGTRTQAGRGGRARSRHGEGRMNRVEPYPLLNLSGDPSLVNSYWRENGIDTGLSCKCNAW